ncbi:MAG: hypothetical protein ABL957_04205 [Parvularculaceae bacterium]
MSSILRTVSAAGAATLCLLGSASAGMIASAAYEILMIDETPMTEAA